MSNQYALLTLLPLSALHRTWSSADILTLCFLFGRFQERGTVVDGDGDQKVISAKEYGAILRSADEVLDRGDAICKGEWFRFSFQS